MTGQGYCIDTIEPGASRKTSEAASLALSTLVTELLLCRPARSSGNLARHGFALLLTWQQRAHDRSHLGEMDVRGLRDVGLTRSQAIYEAGKPFWRG